MKRPVTTATVIGGLGAALLGVGLVAGPVQARTDPGTPAPVPTTCYLERLGTQLVRCDDLTGNGVPAPFYIPERR